MYTSLFICLSSDAAIFQISDSLFREDLLATNKVTIGPSDQWYRTNSQQQQQSNNNLLGGKRRESYSAAGIVEKLEDKVRNSRHRSAQYT